MAIALAVLTIVGPALAPLLVLWLERVMVKKQEQPHADIDTNILSAQHGHDAGRINLSLTLERLQREAQRKRRHP